MGDVERELRDLEARYAAMVEQAPEAIVVFDLESGQFVEANAQACRIFGLARDALLREGPVSMSPTHQPDGSVSEVSARAQLERALAGEAPTFEWTHQNLAGEPFLCRVQLVHVPSSQGTFVRACMVDISDARESEKARERYREIVNAMPDLVGLADAQGRTLDMNPAARRALGLGLDEDLSGLPVATFHTEASVALILEEGIPAAVRDGLWRGETEFLRRDGTAFPAAQVLIAHKDARGELEYLSTVAHDIRDRLAAEQLERRVMHAQKLESLGVLAGGIAHDFNNILVGILANASTVVALTESGGQLSELGLEIQSASQRAAQLAQQMLAYAGKARFTQQPLDLAELISDVARLASASISKNASLEFDFTQELSAIVGDPAQLRQVLMNLIINASDSMEAVVGVISVRTALRVPDPSALTLNHLPAERVGHPCVMVEVSDSGCGMDAALVRRIFDPFFTTKFTGRGLGLASVMGVVRGHHAALEVETEAGQGTSFRLYFSPSSEPVEQAEQAEGTQDSAKEGEESSARHVLVVDDESIVRRALGAILPTLGYECLEAEDGAAAEVIFREHADQICAVLLDLTMPGLSGIEVLARLRAIRPETPVILTSGFSDSVDASAADGFLAKPFTADDLEAALVNAMS